MTQNDATDLSEQTVTINGLEHTMLLNEEDAKRYKEAEESRPKPEEGEARTAKSSEAGHKAKRPENK